VSGEEREGSCEIKLGEYMQGTDAMGAWVSWDRFGEAGVFIPTKAQPSIT